MVKLGTPWTGSGPGPHCAGEGRTPLRGEEPNGLGLIRYVDNTNLNYDATNIHPNFNFWSGTWNST
ncbi:MAG: hypothetical protein IRY87_16955 [Acetobacteraceae bacterium]|nr:hypothetical protein [Acetobacteraceae bacterium]